MKDQMYIFRTWTTTKDGEKIYAKDYGKKAFRIPVEKQSSMRGR